MPWGHSDEPSKHDLELRKVSLKAVEAIQDVEGRTYKTGSINSVLYPISGIKKKQNAIFVLRPVV
jgi:hypothetical protein